MTYFVKMKYHVNLTYMYSFICDSVLLEAGMQRNIESRDIVDKLHSPDRSVAHLATGMLHRFARRSAISSGDL